MDRDVLDLVGRGGRVGDGAQQHRAPVLVEELGRGVDVEVGPGVGPADDHDGVALRLRGGGVVDAVVVDGGLEEVAVFLEPVGVVIAWSVFWLV